MIGKIALTLSLFGLVSLALLEAAPHNKPYPQWMHWAAGVTVVSMAGLLLCALATIWL